MTKYLTPIERETVVTMNDEEGTAHIVTHQRTVITKLKKNPGATLIEEWKDGNTIGAEFTMSADLITFRNPRRAPRKTMTDAQRAAIRQRMKDYHASKKV